MSIRWEDEYHAYVVRDARGAIVPGGVVFRFNAAGYQDNVASLMAARCLALSLALASKSGLSKAKRQA